MKYIRTESGIYEVVKSNSRSTEFIYPTKKGIRFCYRQNNKCKFADTIEELCDEFRGIWINYWEREKESEQEDAHEEYHYDKERDVFYDDFEELTREEAIEKFDIFYGAIWTSKGLIFVTKLNDDLRFKLL